MSHTRQTATGLFFLAIVAAFYLLLGSHNYTDIDGTIRSAVVYHQNALSFHVNNHMLYPVNVLGWNRLIETFAGPAASALHYMDRSQVMNGLATIVVTVLLFSILRIFGAMPGRALAACLLFAASHAVMINGLNANEPMMGLMWAVFAIWLAAKGWQRQSVGLFALCGLFFALAMATYQSMVLAAIAAALIALTPSQGEEAGRIAPNRRRWAMVAAAAASGLFGIVLIYGISYQLMGIAGVWPKVRNFFVVEAIDAQGYWAISKLLHLPLGFADAVVNSIPAPYSGLRWLANHWRETPFAYLVMMVAGLFFAFCMVRVARSLWHQPAVSRHTLWCVCGMLVSFLPLTYWDTLYLKLWLMPLFFFSLWLGLCTRLRTGWLVLATAITFACSLQYAWRSHRFYPEYLVATVSEASRRMPEGSLVFCSWDEVCQMFYTLEASRYKIMLIPTLAMEHRVNAAREATALISAAQGEGQSVFWLASLDIDKPAWDGFIGLRMDCPYEDFERFRQSSQTIDRWVNAKGVVTTLRLQSKLN